MIFYMVWSILFRVLALKTLKWKYLIGCWRTSTNEKVVSWPNNPSKMNHTMWKSMKNCVPKWCCKLCAFLFRSLVPFERCATHFHIKENLKSLGVTWTIWLMQRVPCFLWPGVMKTWWTGDRRPSAVRLPGAHSGNTVVSGELSSKGPRHGH